MPIPPERTADQLTGEETIGGTIELPNGTIMRIRAKLKTLAAWSAKVRDQAGDITIAVAAWFRDHPDQFKGDPGRDGAPGANGLPGAAATVAIGSVTAVSAGSALAVTNRGTSAAAVLDFAIPRGATGASGPTGPSGSEYIGTAIVSETAALAISAGDRWVTATLSLLNGKSIAASDSIDLTLVPTMTNPNGLPAGYKMNAWCATGANTLKVLMTTPLIALGAGYSISFKVFRRSA